MPKSNSSIGIGLCMSDNYISQKIMMTFAYLNPNLWYSIDVLAQDCSNSVADAL